MRYTDGMQPLILTVRAVGSEFVRRALKPLIIVIPLVLTGLLSLGAWLITRSAWWWLLEAVLIMATIVIFVAYLLVQALIKTIEPVQNREQRQGVRSFVDKLERTAENLQTPQPVILYRIVRDIVKKRQGSDSFITAMARDSRELAPDFRALQKHFGS